MASTIGNYTIIIGCKIIHPIKNEIRRYIAHLLLKPIGFICKHLLKFEIELYMIDEKKG
jgi:hypothetical protein